MLSVRPATEADAAQIAAVNVASWEAAYRGIVADAFLDGSSVDQRAAYWAEMLVAGRHPVFVARDADTPAAAPAPGDDAIVGYCGLSLPARDPDVGSDTAEIATIYVAPGRFRSGVGSALMTCAAEAIRAAGFRHVVLWVLSENRSARAFYASHGFVADGTTQWIDTLAAEEMRLRRQV